MLYKIQATYFPVFGLNTGKYEPEKTPYLDTFHAVLTEVLFMNSTYFAKVNGNLIILKYTNLLPKQYVPLHWGVILMNNCNSRINTE